MSNEIKLIGKDSTTDRDLYLLDINSFNEVPATIKTSGKHFACLIASDSYDASNPKIKELVRLLIANGAAYFCVWGKGCEKVHDVIDEVIFNYEKELGAFVDNQVIMTAWYGDESIEEALWALLNCTIPAEYYESTLNSNLVISIGNENNYSIIRDALSNPKLFEKNILDKEEE